MAASWRTTARDVGLLFVAALGGTLVSVLLAARLGVWLLSSLRGDHSLPVRLLLGTAVLDLSKAPALLLLALGLARVLQMGPTRAALTLLGFTYGLEVLATLALGQGADPPWPVLLSRLGAVLLLLGAVRWVLKRRRPPPPAGEVR